MEALPPSAGAFLCPVGDFHTSSLEGERAWRKIVGGSYQGLRVGSCPKWVLVFHWLALGHMTTPNCKGDWETWYRHVQTETEGLDLGKLLGAYQRIECGGLVHLYSKP